MASRKCNASGMVGARPARPHPLGGVGVVDPDGDRSGRSGAACDAGSYFELAQPSSRPEKQVGLCGQPASSYYSATSGKSFDPINSGVQYTSYEVIVAGLLGLFRHL